MKSITGIPMGSIYKRCLSKWCETRCIWFAIEFCKSSGAISLALSRLRFSNLYKTTLHFSGCWNYLYKKSVVLFLIHLSLNDIYIIVHEQGVRSGVCVATVLLMEGVLVAANVGDCRVVSRNCMADALSSDHRAGREDEQIRIENTAGGYVSCNNGVWRVHGSLAISRAIGDSSLKKWVISAPETSRLHLTPYLPSFST